MVPWDWTADVREGPGHFDAFADVIALLATRRRGESAHLTSTQARLVRLVWCRGSVSATHEVGDRDTNALTPSTHFPHAFACICRPKQT